MGAVCPHEVSLSSRASAASWQNVAYAATKRSRRTCNDVQVAVSEVLAGHFAQVPPYNTGPHHDPATERRAARPRHPCHRRGAFREGMDDNGQDEVGAVVDQRFEILARIGDGGMARVYSG